MAMEDVDVVTTLNPSKYSNRVLVKTILERSDGGLGLLNQRVVVGGWVKSSNDVRKEAAFPSDDHTEDGFGQNDVSCVEILQAQIPFLRTIGNILARNNHPLRDKLASVLPKPPPPSIAFLQMNDGSCVASLQVVVDSSIISTNYLLPTGTCIVAEGELKQPSVQGKHFIELKAEKILHIGRVDQDYPLSRKRVPLPTLRNFPHFRPRTTTVASVMRIRSALTLATHTFFQNHGFLYVQPPIMTTVDCEGFSENFLVTIPIGKRDKLIAIKDTENVSLKGLKAIEEEKSNLFEELRSESKKDGLVATCHYLGKTNDLASQSEATEKSKCEAQLEGGGKVNFSDDYQTYLTSSGRLYLECYACSLGNVYSFGPRFKADNAQSAKHVAEMWTVETEIAFSQLKDGIHCANDLFKFVCKWVLDNCYEDMNFVCKRIDKTSIHRLQSMQSSQWIKISYTEAVNFLNTATDNIFETKPKWGIALTSEHLSYLADKIYKKPIVIYNHPKEVKPFYVRLNDDEKTVAAFDMVVPKIGMLISGSQNDERASTLNKRFNELGLQRDQYEWYLDLRRHGTVQHCGFSLKFDEMVQFATGLINVRDVIPFPVYHVKG